MRRQRTRRSPRGVRFEPEVSADTSRSRPDTSAGATDTRGGGRLTAQTALSRRPCRLNFVIALLPALNVRVPTSHPVPQAKPGSIHPPWAWEASPTTVPMPATAPKGASTSRKVRDPESVNHPPPRSACAHPTRRCSRPSRLPIATPPRIAEILGSLGVEGSSTKQMKPPPGFEKRELAQPAVTPDASPSASVAPKIAATAQKSSDEDESFSPTAPTQAPALDRTGSQTPERGAPSRGELERGDRLGG